MSQPVPVRVLIVDDHPALRLGLAAIVDSVPDLVVVGDASDGEGAIHAYRTHRPDVMTLDLRMPALDGLEVIGRIVAFDPDARILVLTMYEHEEDVFRSVRAGAKGYLLKSATREDIVGAIRQVSRGERYFPSNVALKLASHLSTPDLTRREQEVLELVRLGITNKEIGNQLDLTEGTIKTHVREILAKLGAISRTEAVNLAIQRGLLK